MGSEHSDASVGLIDQLAYTHQDIDIDTDRALSIGARFELKTKLNVNYIHVRIVHTLLPPF